MFLLSASCEDCLSQRFFTCSDFGMMGEMKENVRDGLIEASVHLVNREYDALAGDFVTLG